MFIFLLNLVESVEETPVIAATAPVGTPAKAPIPVTAVAIPAEESAAVTAPNCCGVGNGKGFFIFFCHLAVVISLALQFVLYIRYILEAKGSG